MNFLLLLFVFLGLVCCLLAWWLLCEGPLRKYARLLLPGFVLLWAGLGWQTQSHSILADNAAVLQDRPVAMPANGYVSSDECRACHPGKYESWHKTYHRTMTQVPGPESVRGDFSGRSFDLEEVRFRPYQEDGRYFVSVTDLRVPPDQQKTATHEITLLTGSHNYQVYWYETDRPRELGQVPIVYFIQDQRWIPRQAGFIQPHKDILGDNELGRWNQQCVLCHAVNGREVRDAARQLKPVDTRVSEFGIACESCHGPAAEHVEAYRNPLRRYLAHFGIQRASPLINPQALDANRAVHLCGQCHSVQNIRDDWWKQGSGFRPGQLLEPDRQLIWGEPEHWTPKSWPVLQAYYWRDGVVRVRGREFHDVQRSPCFESGGFSCLTCHSLHGTEGDTRSDKEWADKLLKPAALDGSVCLGCHGELSESAALQAHTHHAADSSGSACMNCHMPNTSFGFLRGMRNHRITVPNVWDSLSTGRPVACNQCHLDQTLAWTSALLQERYGQEKPELPRVHHQTAASLFWIWAGDAGQRALGAWNLRWKPALEVSGSDWVTPHLLQLLRDDYPGVRQVALRSLELNGTLAPEQVPVYAVEKARERAVSDVITRWEQGLQAATPTADRSRLLLHADGSLDAMAIRPLIEMRDPAPMLLRE